MTDKIIIAFSPCPNDTFMMAGLVSGKVGVEGFTFIPYLADIEELNNLAQEGQMDVLKMSVNAYPMASINYQMLRVGAALGTNNGPVVVCKPGDEGKIADTQARIAVPGMHTTANLLMTIFYPELTDKTGVLFSEIEKNVLNGNFDIGVLIHENRLTYAEKGLVKIADLGVLWKEHNDCALPLGCFAVKRRLQLDYKRAIEEAIRKSIKLNFGLNLKTSLGIGYLHSFSTQKEYQFKNGSYKSGRDRGNSRVLLSLGTGLGYRLQKKNRYSPEIFMIYQGWAEYPYSPGFIPVMTHTNLQLGTKFFIHQNKDKSSGS